MSIKGITLNSTSIPSSYPADFQADLASIVRALLDKASPEEKEMIAYGDIAYPFQPSDVGIYDESFVTKSATERLKIGLDFWRNNEKPVTPERLRQAIKVVAYLASPSIVRASPEFEGRIAELFAKIKTFGADDDAS